MDTDALKMSIEDLECSVSTSEFLGSLGVTTLGALLALPEIRVHDSIPVKKAASIMAELEDVFESLGVKYRGSLIGPLRPEAQLTATGTVGERWQTIAAWLEGEFPRALAGFSPPASPTAIAAAERELGVTLPDDYKQFLAIHNGQAEFEPMVGQGSLLPVEKLAAVRSGIYGEESAIDASRVGEGVRPVEYSERWIPISRSSRGRDYLCVDLDPAPGGVSGQIIEYVVDDDARSLIARSFAELLSLYLVQAQTGGIDLDRDDDDLEDEG